MLAQAVFGAKESEHFAAFDADSKDSKKRAYWSGKIKSKLEEYVLKYDISSLIDFFSAQG